MAAAPGQPALLFDLDGTLTDPFVGITRCICHAMEKMGLVAPDVETLRWCIGPPLQSSFKVLLKTQDEAHVAQAVAHYRERYSDVGKFENILIEGIPELLAALASQGYFMAVATSKLQSYAGEIVEHFGLMPYFHNVHGSAPDGRNSDKAHLINHILAAENIEAPRTLMIGDRMHDIVGAGKNGVVGLGVLWGYGDRDELEGAGAAGIADDPVALGALIREKLPLM